MRRIRNFIQGGGGSRSDGRKTVWTTSFFFCFVFFYSPELILQLAEGVQWFYYREKLYFSKDPEGVQNFPGGGGLTFSLC